MNRIPWWVIASFVPLGFGAWAPLIPGLQVRRPLWIALGALWTLIAIAGFTMAQFDSLGDSGGGLIILGWVGAIATSLAIRPAYLRTVSSGFDHDRRIAAERLHERKEAREICERDPDLALELGIGRPDRQGARHAGLIDVNHANERALQLLPGVDPVLAKRIVKLRQELNGFSSLADCGDVLDLDGDAVERLRERAVFLPR